MTISEEVVVNIVAIVMSILIVLQVFLSMKKLGTDKETSIKKKIIYISVYLVMTFISAAIAIVPINFFIIFVVTPYFGHVLYNEQKIYIVKYVLLCMGLFLAEIITGSVLQYFLHQGIFYVNSNFYLLIIYQICVRTCEFLVLRILTWIMSKFKEGNLTGKQLVSSLILPVFSIFFMYSLLYMLQIYPGDFQLCLFMINMIVLLIVNIYFSWLFEAMAKNNEMKLEINSYHEQMRYQYKYYKELERKYQDCKKVIHDIKNHLQTIESLSEIDKKEGIRNYSDDMHELLNTLDMKYYTDNRVLNMILNDKVLCMQEDNIDFNIKANELQLEYMREIDITTIFANLIDNAIDSSRKAEVKKISFKGTTIHQFVSITIRNTVKDIPKKKSGLFVSSKAGHEGLGLKNVMRTLKTYDGDIQFNVNEENGIKYFEVNIMIPIPDKVVT